jgi:hypothetical protein
MQISPHHAGGEEAAGEIEAMCSFVRRARLVNGHPG